MYIITPHILLLYLMINTWISKKFNIEEEDGK